MSEAPSVKPKYPSDVADKFLLRMPDGMLSRVRELATGNRRSINSELLMIIERGIFDPLNTAENEKGAAQAS